MSVGLNLEEDDKALAAAWEKNKRAEDPKKKTFVFVKEDRLPLEKGKDTVVRVLTTPVEVNYSFIMGDSGKPSFIKFPDYETDPNFILYRICDRVLEKKWKGRDADNKAIWELVNELKHPEIFNMVYNNGKTTIDPKFGAQGWVKKGYRPDKACYVQVANRQPFTVTTEKEDGTSETKTYSENWCFETKKSLLLVKDLKGSICPTTVRKGIVDLYADYGPVRNYDVVVSRLDADPWYTVRKAEGLTGPKSVGITPFVKPGALPSDYTAAVQLYDLEDMAKPSTATRIYEVMKAKIKMIDDALGSSYLKDLEILVEKEANLGKSSEQSADQKAPEKPF